MPTISRFFGIAIRMYYDDHAPPHFHAYWSNNMCIVASVRPLDDFRLQVGFKDGTSGIVPLKHRLFGPVFEPLRDPTMFLQVSVDEFGAVCWPNGADLAPDALYEQIRAASMAESA